MKITANIKSNGEIARTIVCNVPDVSTLTEEQRNALATDAYVIAAQSHMRSLGSLERKSGRLTDAQIADKMSSWAPGTRTVTRDPVAARARLVAQIARLTDAERIELGLMVAPAPAPTLHKKRA